MRRHVLCLVLHGKHLLFEPTHCNFSNTRDMVQSLSLWILLLFSASWTLDAAGGGCSLKGVGAEGERDPRLRVLRRREVAAPLPPSLMPAPSSTPVKTSQRNTWGRFHEKRWPGQSPLPLTPERVTTIVKDMKEGGYKSIPNYLAALRRWHIEDEHPVSEALRLALADGGRAGRWRRGPPRRSRSFRLELLCIAFSLCRLPSTIMLWPHVIVAMASVLLLRTAEMGNLFCHDVVISSTEKRIAVHVSSSKTDTQARGCKLKWGCICDLGGRGSLQMWNARTWFDCVYHLGLLLAVELHGFQEGDPTPRKVGGQSLSSRHGQTQLCHRRRWRHGWRPWPR